MATETALLRYLPYCCTPRHRATRQEANELASFELSTDIQLGKPQLALDSTCHSEILSVHSALRAHNFYAEAKTSVPFDDNSPAPSIY